MRPAQLSRTWTEEEQARLRELVLRGLPWSEVAVELGRSVDSVHVRWQRLAAQAGLKDRWGRPLGQKRWWTRERVVAALADYAARNRGPLPTDQGAYQRAKGGHYEWPPAARVLEFFETMADAWEAVPGTKGRHTRGKAAWTQAEDDLLLSLAGEWTLKVIAPRLNRSWAACKRRLYDLGAGRARDVSGYLSALQVAAEYGCPADRVTRLIASGELKAHKVTGGHYWRIDPLDAAAIAARLRAPRRTQKRRPLDVGDYRRRYGLRRRQMEDGSVREVGATAESERHLAEKRARRREREQIAELTRELDRRGLVVDVRAVVAS